MIDQLYDGLQLMGEKELLDCVNSQRQKLENEIKDENKGQSNESAKAEPLLEQVNNARGHNHQRRLEDMQEIMIEHNGLNLDAPAFQVRAERWGDI